MGVALLSRTAAVGGLVDTTEHVRGSGVAAYAVVVEHILTVHEEGEGVGHPFAGLRIDEGVILSTASESTVRLTVETAVAFLVEDEDTTLVTDGGHLVGGEAVLVHHSLL